MGVFMVLPLPLFPATPTVEPHLRLTWLAGPCVPGRGRRSAAVGMAKAVAL